MAVDSSLLQFRAIETVSKIFELYTHHRNSITMDIGDALLRLDVQCNPDKKPVNVQKMGNHVSEKAWNPHRGTLLVLSVLQSSSSFPAAERSLCHGLEAIVEYSDLLWTFLLQRVSSTKADESQSKHVFVRLVNDLLECRSFPEYVISDLVLFRLCQLC